MVCLRTYSNEVAAILIDGMRLVSGSLSIVEWKCAIAQTAQMCIAGCCTSIHSPHAVGGRIFRDANVDRQVFDLARELIRPGDPVSLRAMDA